ncbi:inositol monophosphatase family protein [Prosthecomicrobium sp. N25]|uniref:inositol monophosphatase family protein n=1 Tax=Prosthecomicrobium sp. N25 TaxID=3129254 RepID=UPI0030785EDA
MTGLSAHVPSYRLSILIRAARLGGSVALAHRADPGAAMDMVEKKARDYQTEGDRAVERAIAAEILEAIPGVAIVGEEQVADRAGVSGLTVLIDPIDGTTNFAWGIPFFSVCIALQENGETIAGVVHDPVRGETFAAERGRGATLNGRRLHVPAGRGIDRAVVGASIPVPGQLRNIGDAAYRAAFWRVAERASAVRRMGSAALSIAYVAAGRHDAFFEDGLSPYDYAAAVLCVVEAGGIVTGFDGGPIPPTGAILAATPAVHAWLVEGFRPA